MRIFLFLDYDGTLVPIRRTPGEAVISPEAKRLLAELSAHPSMKVVIVTGRSLRNIKAMVGLKGLIYMGNHGLEVEGPGIPYRVLAGKQSVRVISKVAGLLQEKLSVIEGVLIENKGLTLSLHFRNVKKQMLPEAISSFKKITLPFVRTRKVRVCPGKKVLEVRPAVNWSKGKAVRWLLDTYGAGEKAFPVYIGDDATDEQAFKALGARGMTVHVGRTTATLARYRCKNPRQVLRLLGILKEVCGAPR